MGYLLLERKMKRSFLATICLFVAAAFAGPYDIEEFAAQDPGSPDEVITAEFGGELKTIPVEEVSSLQEGRLVVRQKFVDPFGAQPPSYQIYQGAAGDMSSMTALTAPEGTDYSALVKAKLYPRRGMPATDDVEKVYFDGKSVFVPGATTAIAFIDGSPVQLNSATPASDDAEFAAADEGASVAKDEEECDENDPDCEAEEEEEEEYDVADDVDNEEADNRADAAYDASSDVTDRFGIADEVRFWSAVGLAAVFVGSAVMGVLQHSKANEAKDAYDDLSDVEDQLLAEVDKACNFDGKCREAMIQKADLSNGGGYTIAELQKRKKTNKKTQDSYSTARNIWFGVAGLSLTAAIVLYVW